MKAKGSELRKMFGDIVSSGSFKVVDGYLRIIGKWSEIELVGDWIDITLFGTSRKITYTLRKLPQEWEFRRLDGEAYTQTRDLESVRLSIIALGIKKKKRISQETRDRLATFSKGGQAA